MSQAKEVKKKVNKKAVSYTKKAKKSVIPTKYEGVSGMDSDRSEKGKGVVTIVKNPKTGVLLEDLDNSFFTAKKAGVLTKFRDNVKLPGDRLSKTEKQILTDYQQLSPIMQNRVYNKVMKQFHAI